MKTALQNFGKFKQVQIEKEGLRANKGELKFGAKQGSWPRKTTMLFHRKGIKRIISKVGENDKEHITMLRGGKGKMQAADSITGGAVIQ